MQPHGGLTAVAEEGDGSVRLDAADTGTPGRVRETSSLSTHTQDMHWPPQSILHRQQSAGGSVLSLPASSGPSPIASQVHSQTAPPKTRFAESDAVARQHTCGLHGNAVLASC